MREYAIEFHPSAYRAFAELDPAVKRRLAPAIDALRMDPRPPGAKMLTERHALWRIRIGSYRVVYAIEDDRLLVLVVRLGPRGSAYRGL